MRQSLQGQHKLVQKIVRNKRYLIRQGLPADSDASMAWRLAISGPRNSSEVAGLACMMLEETAGVSSSKDWEGCKERCTCNMHTPKCKLKSKRNPISQN